MSSVGENFHIKFEVVEVFGVERAALSFQEPGRYAPELRWCSLYEDESENTANIVKLFVLVFRKLDCIGVCNITLETKYYEFWKRE